MTHKHLQHIWAALNDFTHLMRVSSGFWYARMKPLQAARGHGALPGLPTNPKRP